MPARIYQPPRSAMQAGRAGTDQWVLDFEQAAPRVADPIMGWIGSPDTRAQVKLTFETREEAIAFAESNGIDYAVALPTERRVKPKAYADNFRSDRREAWTH